MPLERTFSPDVRKAVTRSAAALACVLMLASCDAGEPEVKIDHPCEITPSSEEEALLREISGGGFKTEIYNRTNRLVEKLERELRDMGPEKATYHVLSCGYLPANQQGVGRANFTFGWAPRAAFKEPSVPSGVPSEVNGALGVANDTKSKLFVQCDMPGELDTPSHKAWLSADASYTVNTSRTDIDQAARDRQTALAYLMTRRVTEALGCENKPLEPAPVVKPLPKP